MIKTYLGDITKLDNIKCICNAANGIGPMGGGVAGAIRRAGGTSIQDEAFAICKKENPQPGDIYVTKAGTLPYSKIVHLVTMKYPGGDTSLEIVEKCLCELVKLCQKHSVKSIALPALGTGIGGLNYIQVAKLFVKILNPINDIEFHVVDINFDFIGAVNYYMRNEVD